MHETDASGDLGLYFPVTRVSKLDLSQPFGFHKLWARENKNKRSRVASTVKVASA